MRRIQYAVLAALVLLASCGQTASDSSTPAPPAPADTATPAETTDVFCQEVGRRVSPTDCETYLKLAQSAQRGMAAFNAPNPMRRGETHLLQLAISAPAAVAVPPTPDQTPPPEPATETPTPSDVVGQLPGETVQFEPRVGRFMRAELSGVGFDITPQSPAMQEVTPDSVTTWSWQVIAREGGPRSLTLTTVVEGCTGAGECVPLRSTTQNYTVDVKVKPLDQARDFLTGLPDWIKIVSAIIAAIAGLIVASLGLRNAFRKAKR